MPSHRVLSLQALASGAIEYRDCPLSRLLHVAALLTDAELAALVAMAGAADDADVCLQHGCDADEAILAEKEAAEVAPELY